MKRLLVALLALIAVSPAFGQALLQGGAWTQGHSPMYSVGSNSQPIVQDSGSAAGGGIGLGLAEQLLAVRSPTNSYPAANAGTGPLNTNWCDYDAPTTNATGYHFLCMSPNAQGGGLIAYGFGGGAASLPFSFNINGTAYQFPFTTTGVVGPGSSTVNDVACWNNTAGTLLKDCGGLVSLSANNVWTGTNNFTSTFQIQGTTQTFPPSGSLVGASDVQTLTNKSINASEVNSGTLPAGQMPGLTGDVTSSAGTVSTAISANAVTNAKLAQGGANTIKGNPTGSLANEQDISMPSCSSAGNALQWLAGTGIQCGTLTGQTAGWGLNLSGSAFSVSTSAPPFGFDVPINMSLSASAGASALTINLLAADTGSAPAAGHPVLIPFRSTTLATGTVAWTAVTSSLSIVVPSGATLGTTNNVPFRLWIFAAYNSGTPELGVATCSSATQVYSCAAWEYTRTTTTTMSGLATSLGTLYATSGVSNDAVRIIGYCDFASGLATVGSWASACTTLQPFGPGIKKPGDVIQFALASSSSATTGNGVTNVVSAPSVSITPTTSPNLVRVITNSTVTNAASGIPVFQIYRAAGASAACTTAVGALLLGPSASGLYATSSLSVLDAPGSAAQQTYTECFKSTAASNHVYCSAVNGTQTCTIEVQEIMGALESDNDNNLPLTMTG